MRARTYDRNTRYRCPSYPITSRPLGFLDQFVLAGNALLLGGISEFQQEVRVGDLLMY